MFWKHRTKKEFILIRQFDFDVIVCLVCLTQAQRSPERRAALRLHDRPHTMVLTTGQHF